ncbi:MAG: hypothetical protein V1798_09240 [Pseudomonadota bacterium]
MRNNVIVCVGAAATSLALRSVDVTAGVAAGAALMTADFWVIRLIVRRLLGPNPRILVPLLAVFVFKFGAFLLAAWALVRFLPMNLYAFGAGVAAVVLTTALTAAFHGEAWARG